MLKESVRPPTETTGTVQSLPISEIYADAEFNCRGAIPPITVIELAKSIKERGLLQPILVQPWTAIPGKKYRIVMGYRRFKAHELNLQSDPENASKTINALIKDGLTDDEAIILNLAENIQRADLTITQEAASIAKLKLHGWSEQQVAAKINKSRGWVQVRFMLLELPVEIQDEADKGILNQQQIRDAWANYELGGAEAAYDYVRRVKDAKLRGNKREVSPTVGHENQMVNRKRARTPEEIFNIQDVLRSKFGNGLPTMICAWCAGEIDDLGLHQEIRAEAIRQGKTYMIPIALTKPRSALIHA